MRARDQYRATLLWFVTTWFCALATAQLSKLEDADPLANARSQFKQRHLDLAETDLRAVLKTQPTPEAMTLLAYVLQAKNEPKESLLWFTKSAAIRVPSGEDLRIVALNYVLLNDYPDAMRWLDKSVRMDPQNGDAWYDLGRAKMMQEDYEGAEGPMRKALDLKPKSVKAENNLGVILEAENRTSDAEAAYKKAITWQEGSQHPSEQPLLNYGKLLVEALRGEEAIPYLVEATAIAPQNPKCHEQFARALDQQGEEDRAVEQMELAIKLDPSNPRLHYQLGQIYKRAGQPAKSKQELQLSGRLYGSHSSEPNSQ